MRRTGMDERADFGALRALHAAGLLSTGAYDAALQMVRPPHAWWLWTSRMLLLLGSALVLAGVVFFFAYNWAAMGRFAKFGLLEAGLVGSIAAACLVGIDAIGGKVLLLCGAVLIGVLLAVYGQAYQTGADAFELFAGWAALTVGLVIVADFAGLWLLWLLVLETAIVTYFVQVLQPAGKLPYATLWIALGLVNGVALTLREIGLRLGLGWLGGRWLREILLLLAVVPLLIPTLHFIIEPKSAGATAAMAAFMCLATLAGGYLLYRFLLADMPALSTLVFAGCVILCTGIGKVIFDGGVRGEAGPVFLMGCSVLGVTTAAVMWLRNTAREIEERRNG